MSVKADPTTPAGSLPAVLLAEAIAQGLTVAEMARRSGLSHSTVDTALTSDPRFSTVLKLLRGLGKDLRWLARQLG